MKTLLFVLWKVLLCAAMMALYLAGLIAFMPPVFAADNIAVTAGSGETVAFDEITSVKYQRIKLIYGADGSNAGDVATSNPFPIQLRTSGGTETGTAGNPIQCSLANTGSNATSVNVAVASAISAGNNNIGDVDVASLPSGSVAATTAVTIDYDTGGGTQNMIMHGIALPGSGGAVAGGTTSNPVKVDVVSGASAGVQYTEADTDSTITGNAIMWEDTSDTLRAVSAAKPLPIGDAGGSLTVDNAGTFAVQVDGSLLTSSQLIDDIIVADDAAFTPATTKVAMCGFEFDDSAPDSVNEGDAGAVRMSANRNLYSTIRDAAGNERGANVNASNELLVALSSVPSHAVTNAGTFAVQVDGSALTALQLIDDPVIADDAAFTPATSKTMVAGFEADETATDSVDEGDVGAARITLDRKQIVTDYAHTTGGESNYSFLSTAAVLAAEIKSSAGQVYDIQCFNRGANEVFMRLYNQTGAPASTDTANIVWRGFIPGNAAGAGYVVPFPKGRVFSTGIGIRVSGDVADNDTTVLAANEVTCNVGYK